MTVRRVAVASVAAVLMTGATLALAQSSAPKKPLAKLTCEEFLAVEESFKTDYALTWPEGTAPYPGISELLEKLVVRKQRLAVLSNKPHPFTVEIVALLIEAL